MSDCTIGQSLTYSHCWKLLKQLNEFRINKQFTDVTLICQNIDIAAHKSILAAASPYFMGMFGGHFPESEQDRISIQEMDSHCLQLAINFIYTGQLEINDDIVQELLVTGTFLQLEHMCRLCADYMVDLLDTDNCLGFKHFAEKQNNILLLEAANDYISTHIQDVMQSEEFCEMSYDELSVIFSYDKLYLYSDDAVLRGLARWAAHCPEERVSKLATLLTFIHPACVSIELARSLSILQENPESNEWLRQVMNCEGNVEWRIFVLDKMGLTQMNMLRFDLNFQTVTTLKPLPHTVFAQTLAAYKNILYVQGGSKGRSKRDCFYYNIYRDQWYDLSPLLMERSHHRSLVLNECLYALGGTDAQQQATGSVECLNLVTNKAVFKSHMLSKRSSMGAVVCENVIYAMGGEAGNRVLYSMERYDARVGIWNEMPSMHEVNSYCTSAVINDGSGANIYCCEGLGSCMECFDLRANRWRIINFWEEREFYEIFAVDNKLFSVYGEAIARYDFEVGKWLTVYKFDDSRDWETAVGLQMMAA